MANNPSSLAPDEQFPFRWKLEWDEFFGHWYLLPWVLVGQPTPGVWTENFWTFGAGWLRWGFTISVGRMRHDR